MVEANYDAIKEEFVPIAKVKEILEAIKERTYEQKLAYEHVKRFNKIPLERAEELIKELALLEMRKLKDEQIIKIIDLMPKNVEELRVILAHSAVPFKDEELQQIIDIVKKYG